MSVFLDRTSLITELNIFVLIDVADHLYTYEQQSVDCTAVLKVLMKILWLTLFLMVFLVIIKVMLFVFQTEFASCFFLFWYCACHLLIISLLARFKNFTALFIYTHSCPCCKCGKIPSIQKKSQLCTSQRVLLAIMVLFCVFHTSFMQLYKHLQK